ncbi:hypothetical protein Ahy_B05g076045 [Arachis hypogaea]|uniref:Ubiquitin-like protease family profile domain-containing protein n=1 Tax=Arachis hypogaea TaxID=3818 RepID=A0A444Z2G0_ARAHY|nr:hypothetical protein Ahy_B05g076045 [Arachis hypogaea]
MVCIDRHWWMYAFEIAQKRLWVLDSMNTEVPNNERLKVHAYAGRLIEDMAKVSMLAYEHTENGLPCFYASVPQQDNGCDCSVFVIKFMQFWGLDKPLQHWDQMNLNVIIIRLKPFVVNFFLVFEITLQHVIAMQDVVNEFRKEIILDIVMGPHNSEIGKALQALKRNHVRRN